MSRKPGMSMPDFRRYYEERHVPLVARLLPPAQDYRRNYVAEGSSHRTGHMAEGRPTDRAFDVLTELTYESREAYERVVAALSDPEVGRLVAEDEERFLDRASVRSYVVEEVRSP
ncbi:EthD domain-containing protein [Trujillonella endophytica]|nr:EthD domain-containing protein [Trujillella endophytica]